MNWLLKFIASFILILTYSKEVFSRDFQKGMDAYKKGHNSIALREWEPLARNGHANAQYNLGVMYDKGHGVPRNKLTAIKWYKRAAEQGVTQWPRRYTNDKQPNTNRKLEGGGLLNGTTSICT